MAQLKPTRLIFLVSGREMPGMWSVRPACNIMRLKACPPPSTVYLLCSKSLWVHLWEDFI